MNKSTIKNLCPNMYSGGTPSTKNPEYWGGDIPWLSSGESGKEFIDEASQFITQEGVENSATKLATKNSVIIATAGEGKTRGQVSFLNIDAYINQSLIAMKPSENELLPKYLYYYLKNSYFKLRSLSDITGVRGSLSGELLGNYQVFYPDIKEQEKTVCLLSSIDEKIRFNNKIISELESMAKILYEYWFLQFDFPNENGKPYKSSGGKMVYNEELKREIPDGWEVGLLKDYAEILAGGDKPDDLSLNKTVDKCFEVISNGSENRGICGFTANSRIKVPAITISARGSVGYTFLRLEPFTPVIRLICMIPFDDSYLTFLSETMKHIKFSKNGSIQQQLTIPDLSDYRFVFPCHDVANKFNELVFDFELRKLKAIKENRDLASLRDFLLPMLMNGQVTFKDATEAHND